ncbi:SpoIIE family protein phosphatase [Streptomyces caniscabiei]|uniref:SpoIIE family protein phosphatase n=1 Tax=Streptomyces caniscabiei TaxID=2746961 RepID=UPI00076612B9|nr:SpoIIE family protein phosphatase [Streptomyces caniscabiei]
MVHVDSVAIVDQGGIVIGWSDEARQLTGYAAEEVVGRDARQLLAEAPLSTAPMVGWQGVVGVRHRDGRTLELALRVSPVQDGGGRPSRFFVTASTPGALEPTVAEQVFEQASLALSAYGADRRVLRLNSMACRLVKRSEVELTGRDVAEFVPHDEYTESYLRHLAEVVRIRAPVHFEAYGRPPAGGREHAWTVEMWPVRDAFGEVVAVGSAAFDSSEQHWARQRLLLLNEASVVIGTSLDVVRTADELVGLIVPRFADFVSVDMFDWVLGSGEPDPVADASDIVLRRVAHRSGSVGTPEAAVGLGEADTYPPFSPPARALMDGFAVLSGAGNSDFDQWIAGHEARGAKLREHGVVVHSLLAVPLRARGTTLGVVVLARARRPERYTSDDLALAEELAARAAVCVDNARRYVRERATALTLQHSLLPRRLPSQSAVEVAHRYLPADSRAGVGGDWFDVIPLSGSRVALVVGDVVGHGLQSSATMGRLRAAVRTLADVDLPPDELITHLDDLVVHLATEESGGGETPELCATCLYAVYDPVSRRLSLAAAGHPAPVLRRPDGTARTVAMSTGPPLGIGGLPFEATELELDEGSVVALYTDGLVEDRDRDADQGIAELSRALRAPNPSLEATCDTVLKSLLPERPSDDVALLLARTRALGTDRAVTWDLPSDPAYVATARQNATELLARWGLEDASFVTELIVSELVTNAIRYGAPPVRLRLIRDRALMCEVADGSSTSPHMRRAHAFDEGGRGLMLVAQLTQRWGSRQTSAGKTIWAEQPLPPTSPGT